MSVKGMVYAVLFGSLTAAGAFIVIPLPPVPITAQTFFLNICAVLLGGSLGALSQFIYLMLGVVGLPVFDVSPGEMVIITKHITMQSVKALNLVQHLKLLQCLLY